VSTRTVLRVGYEYSILDDETINLILTRTLSMLEKISKADEERTSRKQLLMQMDLF
jgi:hypothetical protein